MWQENITTKTDGRPLSSWPSQSWCGCRLRWKKHGWLLGLCVERSRPRLKEFLKKTMDRDGLFLGYMMTKHKELKEWSVWSNSSKVFRYPHSPQGLVHDSHIFTSTSTYFLPDVFLGVIHGYFNLAKPVPQVQGLSFSTGNFQWHSTQQWIQVIQIILGS